METQTPAAPQTTTAFSAAAANFSINADGSIDVRQPPTMIRLKPDDRGQPLITHEQGHVAVFLPQYGLMFAVEVGQAADSHAEAIEQAKAVDLFGFTDWRLPERTELQLLINLERRTPAIDTDYFPNTPTDDWYWTATPVASSPGNAWYVYFGLGGVNNFRRDSSGFVRAVRSVPPSQ